MESEEMTLRDYASVVFRRKWLVILPVVLVPLATIALSMAQEPRYSATADVLVREPASASSVGAPERPMQDRVLQNELQRAQGSTMQDEVRAAIGSEPQISVRLAASEDTDVFKFTATSTDPQAAADAANAYAAVYIAARRASLVDDLAARAEVVQERLDALAADIADASSSEVDTLTLQQSQYQFELESLTTSIDLVGDSGATVINAAKTPTVPYEPTTRRNAVLGLVVGLLIGLGAAFLVDYLDNSIRDDDELAAITGLPVLATVPKVAADRPNVPPRLIARDEPHSRAAEAYRSLRTGVQFLGVDRELRIVQVTSAMPGDGKTTTAVNLAVVCARAGQRVLLVDCDLRRPRLHEYFGLDNEVGFTSALVGMKLGQVASHVERRLAVIPSGRVPPDPSELLASPTAKSFLQSLTEYADLVIVDSPPVLAVADPLVVASVADGVIVVASTSDRRKITRAIAELQQIEAPVLGTVLNGFEFSDDVYTTSYGYAGPPADAAPSAGPARSDLAATGI